MLDSNDSLRAKHEKEIFELNLRLVQTLQEASPENIDPEATKELLTKLQDLQAQYAKKVREYEDTVTRHTEERQALCQKYV
jgi:Skp family chaperone for outer membrane proteins